MMSSGIPSPCIMVAPVRRKSWGVHSPLAPPAKTRLSLLCRPCNGLVRFLNLYCRSPTSLLTVLVPTWLSPLLTGKQNGVSPVSVWRRLNWAREKGDRNTWRSWRLPRLPFVLAAGINQVPFARSTSFHSDCRSSPIRHRVLRHSHIAH